MKQDLLTLRDIVFMKAAGLLRSQATSQRREGLKVTYLIGSLYLVTTAALAIPTPQQEQGGETYTKDMCIQSYTERCINLTCLNSESTSCTQDCERAAKDKCASIHN